MNHLRRPPAGGRNPHASGSGGPRAPPGSARMAAAMAGGSESVATGVYSSSVDPPAAATVASWPGGQAGATSSRVVPMSGAPGDGLPNWFQGAASDALGSDWLSSDIAAAHDEEEAVLPQVQTTPSARRRGGGRTVRTRPPTQTATAGVDTDGMATWTDENTRIVCEIFAEQVLIGNRSSTHLNKAGFTNVIEKFKERTNILYTKKQFKNKWEKLKVEYGIWKQLVDKQTGIGWDESGQNIDMPEEWWKKMANAVKGSMRFRYRGLQNEDNPSIMFEDLRNTGDDHWGPSSGVAPSEAIPVDDEDEGENGDGSDPDDMTPSARPKRGKAQVNAKGKKTKTSGGQWFQEQMGKLVEMNERTTASCESIARGGDKSGSTIQEVMALVKDCGAKAGSKEHFIATVIFTKKAEREMFMTLDGPEERFMWLQQKHDWMTRNEGAK